MLEDNKDATLEALNEIRNIMDKSARFISLSGWSGIWSGIIALVGVFIAHGWLRSNKIDRFVGVTGEPSLNYFDPYTNRLIVLALAVLLVSLIGGWYFTRKKAHQQGQRLWNNASRQFVLHLVIPLLAGGIFSAVFIYYGCGMFVAPACLAFYGLALVSGSRHTLSEIRYLGMLDVALGCACLFFPAYGLYFWAMGFGVLNIVYGVLMSNKYDN